MSFRKPGKKGTQAPYLEADNDFDEGRLEQMAKEAKLKDRRRRKRQARDRRNGRLDDQSLS